MGTGSLAAALAQTVAALVAVCLLALAVLRWGGRRVGAPGAVEVLDRAALDARRSVFLVRVGGRAWLLAAGDGPVTVVAELRGDELPAAKPAESSRPRDVS